MTEVGKKNNNQKNNNRLASKTVVLFLGRIFPDVFKEKAVVKSLKFGFELSL
jgi:hypothetical protein